MKLSDLRKQNNLLIAAFAISFFSIILLYMILGIAPFGDRMLIIADSEQQYTSFWNYLREVFLGRQDPVYALEKTMGGNIIGLLGYYAASPMNVLFLLFSLEQQPIAVHLLILLKLSLCSLSMAVYFKQTSGIRKSTLLFTTAYAFCAYTVSYCWSLMWIDGVVLLPLIAIGLYRIARGERPWLYIISLCLGIISCYYIGYMLCAFSVLYFIYLLFAECDKTGKPLLSRIGNFAFSSLLAGGLSAAVLLPVMAAQVDSKRIPFSGLFTQYTYSRSLMLLQMLCPERSAEHDSLVKYVLLAALLFAAAIAAVLFFVLRSKKLASGIKIAVCLAVGALIIIYGNIFEPQEYFLQKLIVGFTNYDEMFDGLPGIYSGLLCLVLLIVYFGSPSINGRKRAASAFFLAMLFISMRFYIPNLMWHGFTENNCFGYRYAFIFSFFVISLAKEAFDTRYFRFAHGVFTAGFTAVLLYLAAHSHPKLAENYQYVLICLALLVICTMLFLLGRGIHQKTAAAVLTAVHILSVLMVPYISWNNYTAGTSYAAFTDYTNRISALSEEVKAKDSSLYRAMFHNLINSPMMFGYNGISHFSSNEEKYVVDFMHDLGVASAGSNWADGNLGTTNALMSLFGVKYYTDNNGLRQNVNALPMAFLADDDILNVTLDSENAFENLNNAFKAISPVSGESIFEELETEKTYINLRQISENEYLTDDGFEFGELVYSFTVQTADPIYFYSDRGDNHGGDVYLNGEFFLPYSSCYEWRIISLGSFEPGEEIRLSVRLDNDSEFALTDTGRICSERSDVIANYHKAITSQPCISESKTDSNIITSLNATHDGQYLLYTIPYDNAWRVYVDGVERNAEKAFGSLLAVPLDAGEHTVEINYTAKAVVPGAVISTLSLLVLIMWILFDKKKRSV